MKTGTSASSSPTFRCGSAAGLSHGRSARRTGSPSSRLPGLGALHLAHRFRRTLLDLVGELVGDGRWQWSSDGALARLKRRWGSGVLQELAAETEDRPGAQRFLFVPEVLASHLRLLLGMVRANRPWRLAARLYRALLAAVVAGAYGLVTSDIWRISATAGSTRLALASIISVSFTSGAVIVAHGLWERAPARHLRDQVVLFNFATAATVLIGIATLYAALYLMILAAAGLLLSPDALGSGLGHAVGTGDYATLAWFTASLATVGGALGAALEKLVDDGDREHDDDHTGGDAGEQRVPGPEASAHDIGDDPARQRQQSNDGENPCAPHECINRLRASRPYVVPSHVGRGYVDVRASGDAAAIRLSDSS